MNFLNLSPVANVNSPNFTDHLNLMDLTNYLSDMTGKTGAWINTEMYLAGSPNDPAAPLDNCACFYRYAPPIEIMRLIMTINAHYPVADHLLRYCARSFNPMCEHENYYKVLRERRPEPPSKAELELHVNSHEVQVVKTRLNFFNNDNEAYGLAMKPNPTAEELSVIGSKKACWSILFPIKAYLLDHPETAKQYRGMMPFGWQVASYYNAVVKNGVVAVSGIEDGTTNASAAIQRIPNNAETFIGA